MILAVVAFLKTSFYGNYNILPRYFFYTAYMYVGMCFSGLVRNDIHTYIHTNSLHFILNKYSLSSQFESKQVLRSHQRIVPK